MVKGEKALGKRIKYSMGDVFLVELEEGLNGVGRVIKRDMDTIFIELYKIKPIQNADEINLHKLLEKEIIYMTWCYDGYLKKGIWEVVGNIPVQQNYEMPYFWTQEATYGEYYIRKGGDTYEGVGEWIKSDKESIKNTYGYGIGFEDSVPYIYSHRLREINLL